MKFGSVLVWPFCFRFNLDNKVGTGFIPRENFGSSLVLFLLFRLICVRFIANLCFPKKNIR